MLKDLNKKMANCVLQQEHAYLSSQLDKKADLDFVQEALSQKANKQSVANALHRKANRSDIDELLQLKVDATDFQNLGMQVQGKCEQMQLDDIVRLIDQKANIQHLDAI